MAPYKLKILMIWVGGKRKDAIINNLIKNKFAKDYKMTVGIDVLTKDVEYNPGDLANLSIWDVSQKERFEFIRSTFFRGAAGILLFFDLSNAQSYEKIKSWLAEIQDYIGEYLPFIMIGWNVDVIEEVGELIDRNEAREFARIQNGIYIESEPKIISIIDDAITELTRRIIDIGRDFIYFKGEGIRTGEKVDLSGRDITSISEIAGLSNKGQLTELNLSDNAISTIKGLKRLSGFKVLHLKKNSIKKMEGFDNLTSLIELDLSENQISTINGLHHLTNLRLLRLNKNNIPEELLEELGGLNEEGYANSPQKFIEYSRMQIKRMKGAAQKYSAENQYDEAIECYKEVLQYDSRDVEAWNNLGFIYYAINELDSAANCFKESTLLEPNFYLTWHYLGLIYHDKKDYDYAIRNYTAATNLKPKCIESRLNLSLIYSEKEDNKNLLSVYEEIFNLDPEIEEIPQKIMELRDLISKEESSEESEINQGEKISSKAIQSQNNVGISEGKSQKTDDFNIFFSFSMNDSELFKISEISEYLEGFPRINKIIVKENDSSQVDLEITENYRAYVLFCTPNSMNLKSINKEWKTAFQVHQEKGLKIVTVYLDKSTVPILLKRFGIKYDDYNLDDFIKKLHEELMKE